MRVTTRPTCNGTIGPARIQLDPGLAQRRAGLERLKLGTYLPDERMPYHGVSHPDTIMRKVRMLVRRCWRAGVPVDVNALERAVPLHDALVHLDPRLLNCRSPEQLAARLAHNSARLEGWPVEAAARCARIVMATHPAVRPITPEEIIMRAADIGNIGASYAEFSASARALHREAELRGGAAIPFEKWIVGAYAYLRAFLVPMLELTALAKDAEGRSRWHIAALRNLIALWRESRPATGARVVAEVLDDGQAPSPPPDSGVCYIGLHSDENERGRAAKELSAKLAKGAMGFVVPGTAQALSLPDGSCDEVILHGWCAAEFAEARRVLAAKGSIHFRLLSMEIPRELTRECEQHRFVVGNSRPCAEGLEVCVEPEALACRGRERSSSDSLRGWGSALSRVKHAGISPGLMREFSEPMTERYRRLKLMGLVSVATVSESAAAVLERPAAVLSRLPQGSLFAVVEPQDGSWLLPRWHGKVEPAELAARLYKVMRGYDPQRFCVTLQPAFEILYNANIVVRSDGSITAEFCGGRDLPSRMDAKLLFRVERDPFLRSFSYTTPDVHERETALAVLKRIPGWGSGWGRVYQPGYYEVAVARGRGGVGIIPLFFDYREHPFFRGEKESAQRY